MTKNVVKYVLQKLLGFKRYLLLFSIYSVNKAIKGQYESAFEHFIELIPDKGWILDIGANIGITMVPIAKAKPSAFISGYEPIKENYETAMRILKLYKVQNAEIHNCALAEKEGELTMIMPMKNGIRYQGLSKVHKKGSPQAGITYTVPAFTLDSLFAESDEVSAIKLDVENYEYEVLCGAIRVLTSSRPVVYCELWPNENRKKTLTLMESIGYSLNTLDEKLNRLAPVSTDYQGGQINFIFIHPQQKPASNVGS